MGLSNNSHGSTTFLNVIGGNISRKVTKDTEGAIARVNKNGVTVYELRWNSLTAMITDITIKNSEEYGDQWEITLRDVIDEYKLQLPISGRITNGFTFRLPFVDFTKEVEINTFIDKKTEKPVLLLKQGGKTLNMAYTKAEPKGLPQLEKVMFKGKEQWDDTLQQAFIKNMVETTIMPKLKQSKPAEFAKDVQAPQINDKQDTDNQGDDLPFVLFLPLALGLLSQFA